MAENKSALMAVAAAAGFGLVYLVARMRKTIPAPPPVTSDFLIAANNSLDSDKERADIVLSTSPVADLWTFIMTNGGNKSYLLLPGTYSLESQLNISGVNGLTLRGSGDSTRIRWRGTPNQNGLINLSGSDNTISDMLLDGERLSANGIRVSDTVRAEIAAVNIVNIAQPRDIARGINMTGNNTEAFIHDFYMDNIAGAGIGVGGTNCEICNFQMSRMKLWGLILGATTAFQPTGNNIHDFVLDMGGDEWEKGPECIVSQDAGAGDTSLQVDSTLGIAPASSENPIILRIGEGGTAYYRQWNPNIAITSTIFPLATPVPWSTPAGTRVVQVWRREHGFYLQGSDNRIHDGEIRNAQAWAIRSSCGNGGAVETGNHQIYNMAIRNCLSGALIFATPGAHRGLEIHHNQLTECGDPRTWYSSYINTSPGIIFYPDGGGTAYSQAHYVHHNIVTFRAQPVLGLRPAVDLRSMRNCRVEDNEYVGSGVTGEIGTRVSGSGNTVLRNICSGIETPLLDTGDSVHD